MAIEIPTKDDIRYSINTILNLIPVKMVFDWNDRDQSRTVEIFDSDDNRLIGTALRLENDILTKVQYLGLGGLILLPKDPSITIIKADNLTQFSLTSLTPQEVIEYEQPYKFIL